MIARNAAYLMVGQVISWSLSLVFVLIVPRAVGASSWGEWSLAWAITSVTTAITGLGLGTLVIKDVSREPEKAREYVGAALTAQLIMVAPFAAIIAVFTIVARYPAHTKVVIAIVTAGALVSFLTTPVTSALLALQKMHFTTFSAVISNGLVSLAAILLVKMVAVGIIAISVASLVGAIGAAAVQIYGLRHHARLWPRLDSRLVRHLLIGGLPYWASGLLLGVYMWVDAVMLSLMTSTTEVGWYGAATRLISTLGFLPYVITMAVFPALSHGFRDDRATGRLAQVSLRLLISLGLPVVVGTAIVGPQVVKLVYGWAFEPAGQILVVLSFSLLPMFISTLVCSFLIAADRQNIWAWVMGAACVINPLINLAAITVFERAYHNGALGAAYALLITDVLIATAALVLLPRELWAPVRAIGPALVRAAAAATIMGVLVWLLRDRFVLAPIAVGTIAFAVSALALKVFTPDDLQQGRRLVGQLRGRFSRRPITSPEPVPAPARTA
jgi:O-antigen/teichoic acid export membrane protein